LSEASALARSMHSVTPIGSRSRQHRRDCPKGASMYSNLWLDIRHAARRLLSSPGFTAAAMLTIALSVGANAAIFGVAKSVLLDSLPYADAGGLVRVYGRLRDGSQDRGPLTAGTIA